MYVRHVCGLAGVLFVGAAACGNTLFVATYDGDTGNAGLDATVAVGNPVALSTGSAFVDTTVAKFGPSSLNPIAASPGGNALQYETAGNFVMNATSAGTIEMWVNTTVDPLDPGQTQVLYSMWQPNFVGTVELQLFTSLGFQDVRLRAVLDTFNSGGAVWFADSFVEVTPIFNDGQWHHVVWNWDLGAAVPFSSMFIDGTVVSFAGFGILQYPGTVGNDFEIGSRQGGFDPWLGRLDDFRFSDTAVYGDGTSNFTPPTESFVPFVATLDGDYNLDGFVGVDDLNKVLVNWNQNVTPGDLSVGDGDGSGFIGVDDLNIVLVNWNNGTPPTSGATVPEPGALVLLGIGCAALLRRKEVDRQ